MPQIELTCQECGAIYYRWPSQVVEGRSKFCSKKCLQVWRKREVIPKHKAPWLRRLNQSPGRNAAVAAVSARKRHKRKLESPGGSREGGRTRYKIKKGKQVHRAVAERVIGRALRSDELVHHIDENSFNNDPSNLCIGITRSFHAWIHTQLKKTERVKQVDLNLLRRKKEGRDAKGAKKAMNYRFKTRPFRHQVKAFKKMVSNKGGALFMEMGTGKTKVAVDWAGAMYMKHGVDYFIVICPKSVKTVWPLEIKKHLPDHLQGKITFEIRNYDVLADRTVHKDNEEITYEGDRHDLMEMIEDRDGRAGIIVDESHKIKKPSAKRTKALMGMGTRTEFKIILTGTPISKNPLDLFAQFKFVNDRIFGTSFAQFKREYCVYGGYGGYQLLRYINLDKLKKLVAPVTFSVKKQDCLDLPARTHEIVPVHLDKQQRKIYDTLAKKSIVRIGNDEIEADNVLVKMLRLSQITSGFVKTADDELKKVGDAKREKAAQLLDEMAEQDVKKVVIFARFKQSLAQAAAEAKNAGYRPILFHGGVKEKDRELRLLDFDETKDNVAFICQIATGSMGISLTAANTVIYWEHTYDYGEMTQSYDRVHRIGQHYPVTYYHLIGRSTVDEAVWMALKAKKNVADLVLTKPELLMSEGIYNV